ncbi:MAG: hypothetical protein JRM73_00560 [Nitrososphaerota archaeon]|nr:hypothetical protein [Nitrososphaerota archaeon]
MKSVHQLRSGDVSDWRSVEAGMRVVHLDGKLQVMVPILALTSFSKSTRGLSLYPGRVGSAIGVALLGAGAAVGYGLFSVVGAVVAVIAAWLLGSAGAAILYSSLRPTAFVKPICVSCRLLSVIKEHEAIHLSGVASEKAVWDSMKSRHSVESLKLEGDPAICTFCPIPKRLAEH